jgi:methylthioribose-1-phosphate isomerase
MPVKTIEWIGNRARIIDQTRLPAKLVYLDIDNHQDMVAAIKKLSIRGAPAIGIAAAYGVALGAQESAGLDRSEFNTAVHQVIDTLAATRPTAVNLFWALERMKRVLAGNPGGTVSQVTSLLLAEAQAILKEDNDICRRIGENGVSLITDQVSILTHCNAGGLATGGWGTALAVIYTAWDKGVKFSVYADETRPLLQGARLTSWELQQAGIPVTLVCDNMAARVMQEGKVSLVIVGADRIAANGDTANKIGTYGVALLAKQHNIPFYVAAPASTFDLNLAHGSLIPIEERAADEVRTVGGTAIAPIDVPVYNPAFDVTKAELITGIITEHGVIDHPDTEKVGNIIGSQLKMDQALKPDGE